MLERRQGFGFWLPQLSFGNTFEAAKCIGDVGLGRDAFKSVSNPSTVMPGPMCRDKAVQRLMFADALDERVSGSFVVAALDIK